ncbi:MAG: hypothetical protein IAF94_03520 [Pirellulaceae bacterium]|nr:hypothetical protein [Pirellulaceae bacterium]
MIVREEQSRTLVEEVVPGLPGPAPLVRRRGMKVLTEKMIEDFCLLLSLGLSRRQVAPRLDIDHSTISHAAGKDEDLAALLRRAEEMAASEPMLCLIAANRKSWRAAVTMIGIHRQFPQPPDREEKDRRMKDKLDDTMREMEYDQRSNF